MYDITGEIMPGEYLFAWLDDTLIPSLGGSIADLIEIISPVMGAGVILSFVLWAIRYVNEQQPLTDLMWRYFKLMAVCFFGLNASYYADTIIPMVNNIPDGIASSFSNNSSAEDVGNVIDNMLLDSADIIGHIWANTKGITWSGIKVDNIANAARATFVIFIGGGIYIALSLIMLFVAKLMVNVVLCLGPIFILCAFFEPTKNYFTLWINQLVNYMLLAIIFSVVFAVQNNLVADIVSFGEEDISLTEVTIAKLLIVYTVCIVTTVVIPVLASSLSGGMGLNGIVGGVASKLGGVTGVAMNAGSKASTASNLGKNNIKPG